MRLRAVTSLACLMMLACTCSLADDVEPKWGHLKGRIVLAGEIPKSVPLVHELGNPGKDGIRNVPYELLIVDDKTKGIQNVVVYLQKKPSRIHPELIHSKEKTVKFQATRGRFVPHVLLVRTDQEIELASPDPFAYLYHVWSIRSEQQVFLVQSGPLRVPQFAFPERSPVPVGCDIHCGMLAYWVVLDHPYSAVTGKDGSFEIKNLPIGEHNFTVWQEKVGDIRPIQTEKFFKVSIAAEKTTSLDVTLPVSMFYAVRDESSP